MAVYTIQYPVLCTPGFIFISPILLLSAGCFFTAFWSHLLLIFIFPRHVTRMSFFLFWEEKEKKMARALSCPLLVFSSASLSTSSPIMPFVNFTP
ncbi:uncharacterized protein ARB_03445 [Trichophyton benhamiae CBS 112371]|uniref:Uncharacterized protein n=1 Tax=Arthroderma benhamiae (strain ATCC MYA-4681 / CBS 112371) TaxID=663331 RepID=D4B4Q5_ARTBC|nr:uncharacterized protein ARB_03445 [Trichophyton benhamiae CBS 112371]EFE30103.1 hypothetical protein ARB_03445 [Trichophyton benhamiae CBS 112371]